MSYILDALNKDQPSGAHDQVTIGRKARREAIRLRVIVAVVSVALLANAIVLVWVLTDRDNLDTDQPSIASTSQQASRDAGTDGTGGSAAQPLSSPPSSPATASTSTPPGPADQTRPTAAINSTSNAAINPAINSVRPRTSPARAEASPQADRVEPPQQVITPAPSNTARNPRQKNPTPRRRVSVKDLPASDAQRYRAFKYSTHIYADDREFRAVVINGTRLTEGDQVMGLQLVEITPTGVVFADGDQDVEVSVLDEWQD